MNIAWLDSPQQPVTMNALSLLGHTLTNVENSDTDATILWSISQQRRVTGRAPLFVYCWDLYEWVLSDKQRGPDYGPYRKICEQAKEVWVPSQCTADRLKEFWGIEHTHVIRTSIPIYERKTEDRAYVLQPLRNLPDKQAGWVEKACEELGITCVSPNHQLPKEEWKETVARCRLIVSGFYEASTGGLSAMEGYYLGKPVLASDSPYCGLRDYLGDRAWYFSDYEDLKKKLQYLWQHRPPVKDDHKTYISRTFSERKMGEQMEERIKCNLSQSTKHD